jgi:hypothetical protein
VLAGLRCHVADKFKDVSQEDDASVLCIEIPYMT